MSAITKGDSYFELDADEAPSFYQSVMAIVQPSQLAAAVLAMFVLQLVIAIIALDTTYGAIGATRHKNDIHSPSRVIASSSLRQVSACAPSMLMTR